VPAGGVSGGFFSSWFGASDPTSASATRARASRASSAASDARAKHSAAASALRAAEDALAKATLDLSRYLGPRAEYAHMLGECYSVEVDKYAYEICPFGEARQDRTRLGSMAPLAPNPKDADEPPRRFSFVAGERCWNGPARSISVALECGAATRLSRVTEPSRCEYAATLETPAACDERDADALEEELGALREEVEAARRGDELR
jgi:protein kinase C substrate 80K-H